MATIIMLIHIHLARLIVNTSTFQFLFGMPFILQIVIYYVFLRF